MAGGPSIAGAAWPNGFHIPRAKLTAYLLDPAHRDGGPKCRFLAAFGFTPQNPDDLSDALHRHRHRGNFRRFVPARQAVKLYFEGPLPGLAGRDPLVRTVWQMDDADPTRTARFITLRPLPRPGA